GILTVNTAAAGSIRPPAWVAFDLVLLSFAIAAFTACGSTAIAVGARNPKGAKRTLRHAFLLLLVIAIYVWRQRFTIPADIAGFAQSIMVVSIVLLGLAAACVKLAWSRLEDKEIR